MRHLLKTLLVATPLLLAAACSDSDWEHFNSVEGDWGSGSYDGLYQPGLSRSQCVGGGGTYGAQGCWSL